MSRPSTRKGNPLSTMPSAATMTTSSTCWRRPWRKDRALTLRVSSGEGVANGVELELELLIGKRIA